MNAHAPPARQTPRPDLTDRGIRHGMAALVVVAVVGVALLAALPADLARPGSPLLQAAAALGALLLLVPFVFAGGKRSGASRVPNRLFVLHVVAGLAGIALVTVHALARPWGPPLLLWGCLLLLLITGVAGRVHLNGAMAATLGTKAAGFAPPDPRVRERLRRIIDAKAALLARLDPGASEALFSVTLAHWLRSPRLSWAYARLAREESRLIGARRSVPFVQAYWRAAHLALAWLFLAGLVAHVVIVMFFAGYAADGGIYWWHLTDWGR